MILWTIRHTKPYNPHDVCYGRLDFDVSQTFDSESSGAINALLNARAKPEKMFTSPLKRCLKLAQKVQLATNLTFEIRKELIELNFGSWEGQKLTAVPKIEMQAWAHNLRGYRFTGGECFYDIDARVSKFLNSLNDNGEFLWITHAGVIASLQHFACGLSDNNFVEGAFSYAMVTRFEFTRNAQGNFCGTFTKIYDGIKMPPLKIG